MTLLELAKDQVCSAKMDGYWPYSYLRRQSPILMEQALSTIFIHVHLKLNEVVDFTLLGVGLHQSFAVVPGVIIFLSHLHH